MPEESTIFVTGFPGFIANRLVERLGEEGANLLLLVQPAFTPRAQDVLQRIGARKGFPANRFHILEGDITAPDCGLSKQDLELARREVGIVFHLAALYDLNVRREAAMRVNTEGTRNVNRLVETFPLLNHYH